MAVEFSNDTLKLMQCRIVEQDINPDDIKQGELPTDVHLVTYQIEGTTIYDLVRAHKMVDIFDPYHDTLKPINGSVQSIKSGFGKVLPRMFGSLSPTPASQSKSDERSDGPFV